MGCRKNVIGTRDGGWVWSGWGATFREPSWGAQQTLLGDRQVGWACIAHSLPTLWLSDEPCVVAGQGGRGPPKLLKGMCARRQKTNAEVLYADMARASVQEEGVKKAEEAPAKAVRKTKKQLAKERLTNGASA
jgi:hypothetical protein